MFFFLLFVFCDDELFDDEFEFVVPLFINPEEDGNDVNSSDKYSDDGEDTIVRKQFRKWLIENDKRWSGTDWI